MELVRAKKPCKFPIVFQAIEWSPYNVMEEEDAEEMDYLTLNLDIYCFGCTPAGESVCLQIQGFKPFFYVKMPDSGMTKSSIISKLKTQGKCNLDNSTCIVTRKDLYGFTNGEEYQFIKLVFQNTMEYNKALYFIKNRMNLSLYEDNVDPVLKFIHSSGIKSTGYLQVKRGAAADPGMSTCNYNIVANCNDLVPVTDIETNAPFLQASFDIETMSSTGAFPDPGIPGDCVIQVSTTFKRLNAPDFCRKNLITLKKCATDKLLTDPTVDVISCETEEDLLLEWAKLINKTDPDLIYHYNGDWFDWHYLYTRIGKISKNKQQRWMNLISRLQPHTTDTECIACCSRKIGCKMTCEYSESNFSSSAYGSTSYRRVKIPGRVNFDILINIKRELKETSYTLNNIAKKYLNESKVDLPYQEMFNMYARGEPQDIQTIGVYCLKDSVLPQRLVDRFLMLEGLISMANVTLVPIRFLIERGQQVKCFSQILNACQKLGYLAPHLDFKETFETASETDSETDGADPNKKEKDSFVGATVLEPEKGAYFQPVTVNDFSSLYPSVIRADNLCYTTFVNDQRYLGLAGIKYTSYQCGENEYTFASNAPSVIPVLLDELARYRTLYKNKMKQVTDQNLINVYNQMQLSYKVSMNSIYGFMAAQTLKCKPIAETTTKIGRGMIDASKEYIEREFPAKVIYGDTDSVFTIFTTKTLSTLLKLKKTPGADPNEIKRLAVVCREEAFEMGKIAGEQTTKALFKKPHSLEFEKVYDPLFLLSKKRYIGAYYGKSPNTLDFIESKGVVTKRRDTFPLLKEAYTKGIELLVHRELEGLAEFQGYLKETVNTIHTEDASNLPLEKFIISKSLGAEYKSKTIDNNKGPFKITQVTKDRMQITIKLPSSVNISGINDDIEIVVSPSVTLVTEKVIIPETENVLIAKLKTRLPESIVIGKTPRTCPTVKLQNTICPTSIPHVVLAEKIGKRDPGRKPRSNDRIPYIFVKKDYLRDTAPVFKKVEDPEYAKRNNLKIDPFYYIKHLKTPICELLSHFTPNPEHLFEIKKGN